MFPDPGQGKLTSPSQGLPSTAVSKSAITKPRGDVEIHEQLLPVFAIRTRCRQEPCHLAQEAQLPDSGGGEHRLSRGEGD
jgi:hypothetical protein